MPRGRAKIFYNNSRENCWCRCTHFAFLFSRDRGLHCRSSWGTRRGLIYGSEPSIPYACTVGPKNAPRQESSAFLWNSFAKCSVSNRYAMRLEMSSEKRLCRAHGILSSLWMQNAW
jgi:hypothetical protein